MTTPNMAANALAINFAVATGAGAWPNIDRAKLALELRLRITSPNTINQAKTPFCGPAAFWYVLASEKPVAYVQAGIDLFNNGECTIGTLKIKPGSTVVMSAPQNGTSAADWLMLAGLRDSENTVFSAGGWFGGNVAGITVPGTLAGWFTAAGYGTVINSADLTQTVPAARAAQVMSANTYRASGHHIVMFIDSDVMYESNQDDAISMYPDHWVTLTTPITDGGALAYEDPIALSVFSWGDVYKLPRNAAKPLKKKYFLYKFYGYLAVKK